MIALTHYKAVYTKETDLFEDVKYPQRVHWFPETYAKVKTGLHYPAHKLGQMVLDPAIVKTLTETPSKKTAFLLASGNAHFAGIPAGQTNNRLGYSYKFLPLTLTQVYAGRLASNLCIYDHISTDASACASSLKVMMDVQSLIKFYGFTRVVVVSLEDAISNLVLEFFGESKACLQLDMEADGKKPSAFDKKNGQFYVGQGAVLAVFESEEGLDQSGFKPEAYLLGAYTASEPCSNAIGQLADGTGFVKAAQGAIDIAQIKNLEIKIVKTHGTGTESNNQAEKSALNYLLKDNFVATSFKPTIGHTMGASGLLETVLLLDELKKDTVPAIANRTEEDKIYLSEPAKAPDGYILSMAAGMGNVYSAAVFGRA